jgi:hypothetical protein
MLKGDINNCNFFVMNMKKIIFILVMGVSSVICAQNDQDLTSKSFQFDAGVSKNGSGDIGGYVINSEFNNYFKKKWSYSLGLGATIHDGENSASDGSKIVSLFYTIAGFQLAGKMGYSLVRNLKNDFGMRLGPLLRFQSSSTSSIGYGHIEGSPNPGIQLYNDDSQETFAVGGVLQLYYNYSINDKMFIGVSGCFQTDTNGDAISQLLLSCGMKF